ncbi:tripartite tricarboxylate transporter substrate binding protein [Pigmentiphaga soli]|uniref:Tripartite tricarboxylate transporter substrate binding protein n=1 Tax=Pigmentiphaga soli TaxID=1007095 RepID=A0ABP8HMI8_9BURK
MTLALLYGALALQGAAAADAWPSKPIKLVVTFPPGGSTDVTGRLIADKLRGELGQSVVVDNRAGAGGNIGADVVAKSPPDGYTLLMATSSHITNISLYKTLPYDFMKDFEPVSTIAFIPNVMVINPSFLKVGSLQEFIAYAKNLKDTKLNFATGGSGTSYHLSNATFNAMTGIDMEHIPYKGGAPAVTALLGGEVQVIFAPLIEVLPHIQAGKLKPLGVTTRNRSSLLPDVPAIGEVLPGYEVALWNAIMAPAGTPKDIVDKLDKAILKVLADPDVKKKLAEQGSDPSGKTPEEFKAFIATEIPKWAKLVKLSGAQAE